MRNWVNSLQPVNLELPSLCNCYSKPLNPVCLVNIPIPVGLEQEMLGNVDNTTSQGQVNNEIEQIQQLNQMLGVEEESVGAGDNAADLSTKEENGSNTLVVVGAWQEQQYQQAIAVCMWRE